MTRSVAAIYTVPVDVVRNFIMVSAGVRQTFSAFLHDVQKISEYFCYFRRYANLKLKEHLLEADKSCLHSFVPFLSEYVFFQIVVVPILKCICHQRVFSPLLLCY